MDLQIQCNRHCLLVSNNEKNTHDMKKRKHIFLHKNFVTQLSTLRFNQLQKEIGYQFDCILFYLSLILIGYVRDYQ